MEKKAVHVSTVHSWQDPRIFLKQCRSLAAQGFEVHLITPDGVDKKVDGVYVHSTVDSPKNRISRFFKASKNIFRQALKLKPDIIHFHDPELIPTALKVQRNTPFVKIVYDVHEDNTTVIQQRDYVPNFLKRPLCHIVDYYEQKAARQFNVIIAEKYYLRRFPNAQLILNYPIIDWMEEKNESDPFCGLIYTGNVREDRGALQHTEILSYTQELEIWNVGRCNTELFERMKKRAGDNVDRLIVEGVDSYIAFEEIVNQYNKKNWLAGLAIFPYSDHVKEKHLTKFFEYMAAGIPIIYSNMGEWKKLLKPLNVGIAVDPENKDEIVKAINTLRENPQLHRKMGENGQKAVLEKFNWRNEEKKLITFYHSL